MTASKGLKIALLVLMLIDSAVFAQKKPGEPIIERVDIIGNRRIAEPIVRWYIQSKPGEPYDKTKLDSDLRSLFKSTFFEKIDIQEKDGVTGKIITFALKEKPIIRSIEYVGNKSFTDDEIINLFKQNKIELMINRQYEASEINAAKRILLHLLSLIGRPLASVEIEIDPISPSDIGLRFVIEEGAQISIGKIQFEGNNAFSDSELKEALKLTKEHKSRTPLMPENFYLLDKIELDLRMNLKTFYRNHGYMKANYGAPVEMLFESSEGMKQYLIKIPIVEGDQYHLGSIELRNCGVLDCRELTATFGLNKGDIVNFQKIEDALKNILEKYRQMGFKEIAYIPEEIVDEATKTYSLKFRFIPGGRVQ